MPVPARRRAARLAAWREQAYRQAALVLDEIAAGGVRCGVPRQIETPCLFTGLAGVGHGLLRLGAPDRVPSLLALDDPQP